MDQLAGTGLTDNTDHTQQWVSDGDVVVVVAESPRDPPGSPHGGVQLARGEGGGGLAQHHLGQAVRPAGHLCDRYQGLERQDLRHSSQMARSVIRQKQSSYCQVIPSLLSLKGF